jgi:hypothetical protein
VGRDGAGKELIFVHDIEAHDSPFKEGKVVWKDYRKIQPWEQTKGRNCGSAMKG